MLRIYYLRGNPTRALVFLSEMNDVASESWIVEWSPEGCVWLMPDGGPVEQEWGEQLTREAREIGVRLE